MSGAANPKKYDITIVAPGMTSREILDASQLPSCYITHKCGSPSVTSGIARLQRDVGFLVTINKKLTDKFHLVALYLRGTVPLFHYFHVLLPCLAQTDSSNSAADCLEAAEGKLHKETAGFVLYVHIKLMFNN